MPRPSVPPVIYPLKNVALPPTVEYTLGNALRVCEIRMGTQEVVRIEVVFWAGRPFEKQKQVARAAAALLKEGTKDISSAQVAEQFDYFGASLSASYQTDTNNLVLYCLERQLTKVLPLYIDLLLTPAYRESDLATYVRRRQLSLKEDGNKPEVVAYRHITACFYGEDHPYGYNSTDAIYQALTPELLQEHHQTFHCAANGYALISGQFSDASAAFIREQLARLPVGKAVKREEFQVADRPASRVHLPMKDAVQSGIRVGRNLFPRKHPDAHGMYVLNTVLGGFFGSRLMTNIREDKGYTYNISSTYETLRFAGSWQIDTEVSPEYVEATLLEVRRELDRLQQERVGEEELTMLRNYLMGSYLSMVDGPFNWAETVRTLFTEALPITAFTDLITTTQQISPAELQQLAQQYFQAEDLWIVVAGQ